MDDCSSVPPSHAQQLDLHRRRHLADLVEEDRAAVAGLNQALLVFVRAGEGAAHMAEQFGLEQCFRHRTAVDGDERTIAPQRQRMYRACDQLLAGAGLTGNQHRAVGAADRLDQTEHLEHDRAAADDAGESLIGGRLAQDDVLVAQAPRLEQLSHVPGDVVDIPERFLEQRRRAARPRFRPLGGILRPVRRHHDHDHVRRGFADRPEQRDPVESRHPDIGEDDVDVLGGHQLARLQAVFGDQHVEPIALEQQAHPLAHRLLIVGDQDTRFVGARHGERWLPHDACLEETSTDSGNETRNSVPLPTVDLTSMWPP